MTLPEVFLQQMTALLGTEEYDAFIKALESESPVSIRLNPMKRIPAPAGRQVPWCKDGYYLSERPVFTLDPLFHAGCYYVQEASSMYLSHVLATYLNESPVMALDLCAAPGGKSTLMLSSLPQNSFLICNEVVRQRAHILRENIIKWGYPNAVVTSNQACDFQMLGTQFDLILCDAPCSGEGMFRKDPKSIQEWSITNVAMCQHRQRDIVADIWPCLRSDGLFIYSTCTYNKKENEDNVQWIADELGADILDTKRFMPHKTEGEGLFMAVLRKNSPSLTLPSRKRTPNTQHSTISTQHSTLLQSWLQAPEEYHFTADANGTYRAILQTHVQTIALLSRHLNVLNYGIELATTKGKNKLQPSHSLAMSNILNINSFTTSEINLNTTLSYLRTESIVLTADTPRGFVLLTYHNHPLGFVNNLGTRANNLYPSEWRIRKL